MQSPGQDISVAFQQSVDGGGEFLQTLMVICLPVLRKEMVVSYIDDNSAAVPQLRVESMFAAAEGRRCFGKSVKAPVMGNSIADAFAQVRSGTPLDEVAEQGSEKGVRMRIDQV